MTLIHQNQLMTTPVQPPRLKEDIDGILLVDKPQGLTSNAVLQRVKGLLGAKKAGHTGSLDPLATGMLPICFGDATKVSQFLLDSDKAYTTTGLLGIKTNTADSMGEIIAQVDEFSVTEPQLREVLSAFLGLIQQVPSMFSALKHQGTPLYKYARKGIEIARPPRDITIFELELLHFDGREFELMVRCSKGTYIRNLVEDIGEQLAVGAHVTKLHRLYTAGFSADPMVSLDALTALSLSERRDLLLPMERAIEHCPRVSLTETQSKHLRQGQVVTVDSLLYSPGIVQLYENETQFLGLGSFQSPSELKAKRLCAH